MTFEPSKVQDGDNVALGSTTDLPTANTLLGRVKNLLSRWPAALGRTTMAGSISVAVASDQTDLGVVNKAGSAIIGKVSTDQTTHGTTDLVAADVTKVAGSAVSVNSGNVDNGTLRTTLATNGANPSTVFTVKEGVDPVGTGAGTQAGSGTVGSGVRGWLGTITGLLQAGTARVNDRKKTLVDDSLRTVADQAGAAALANVAASTGSVTLAAANLKSTSATGRTGLIIHNDSASAVLYLAYAASASLTSFTEKVQPGATYHMSSPVYGGQVSGTWDAAVGTARVTDLS